jgi:hypothetical protein
MAEEEKNPVLQEIEDEIQATKAKNDQEFEIEIADEPKDEDKPKEKKAEEQAKVSDAELSRRVQTRINKVVAQKKLAEDKAKQQAVENEQLRLRIEKLEQGSQKQVQNDFQSKYDLTKKALHTAVEEGDTEAQVNFQEQLADMRAIARVQEMQRQTQQIQQTQSPSVGKAQQQATNPAPPKAMDWWQKNTWFNSEGYERETAAARAIDVQLDLEGHDKNNDDYYNLLNNRLQKLYPELISESNVTQSKQRVKSSTVVAPSTGGSAYRGNRVRMTQDQLRMARELGINDEAGLKKYAQEIQKSQRS